jgi:hypothetical protein
MPSLHKKPCPVCGTIFQPIRKNNEYCSGGCRIKAHRERHALEEPSFMKPTSIKPKVSPLPIVKPEPATVLETNPRTSFKNSDFTDIGVKEYIPNPAYVRAEKDYLQHVNHTLKLIEQQDNLESEIKSLTGVSASIIGSILGGLIAVGLSLWLIYHKAKSNWLWYLLLIPALILGAIPGGTLAVFAYFGNDKVNKLSEAAQKRQELTLLKQEITASKEKELEAKIKRDAVQKQIAKYDTTSDISEYADYEDISSQKAISLESLKKKVFKTLEFTGKWQTLVGTPEANFCCMVYGKPGQGKSYFTLELSEYLSKHFGQVLFNSSEEGASLSLQNKISNFDMKHIFLGDAKNINDLQLLLSKSPYKFVVIDSVNHMNISPEDLRKLRGLHPDKGFICIHQSTKGGDFKGGNEYEHDADISIRIDNRIAECKKTRYK